MTLTIKELVKQVKSTKKVGTAYKVRIPAPDKEFAKENGASWDKNTECYLIYSNDVENHVLKNYVVEGNELWIPTKNIPYAFREEFKAQGVVTEKVEGKFVSYVLAIDKYLPLIEGLQELELL